MTRIKLSTPSSDRAAAYAMAADLLRANPAMIGWHGPFLFFHDADKNQSLGMAEIGFFDGKLRIAAIQTLKEVRGKGYGSFILQQLLDAADAARIPCSLAVQQFGEADGYPRLGVEQLEAWYRRNGFVPKRPGSDEMIRRVGRTRGMTFDAARDLAMRHGGIVRPFEKDRLRNNETTEWGVTDPANMVVPIPDTPAWWSYRQRFFHDLLIEKETNQ